MDRRHPAARKRARQARAATASANPLARPGGPHPRHHQSTSLERSTRHHWQKTTICSIRPTMIGKGHTARPWLLTTRPIRLLREKRCSCRRTDLFRPTAPLRQRPTLNTWPRRPACPSPCHHSATSTTRSSGSPTPKARRPCRTCPTAATCRAASTWARERPHHTTSRCLILLLCHTLMTTRPIARTRATSTLQRRCRCRVRLVRSTNSNFKVHHPPNIHRYFSPFDLSTFCSVPIGKGNRHSAQNEPGSHSCNHFSQSRNRDFFTNSCFCGASGTTNNQDTATSPFFWGTYYINRGSRHRKSSGCFVHGTQTAKEALYLTTFYDQIKGSSGLFVSFLTLFFWAGGYLCFFCSSKCSTLYLVVSRRNIKLNLSNKQTTFSHGLFS